MADTDGSPRAFVSYRREDTESIAGALTSALRSALDVGELFLDRTGIQGGEPWPDRLREELQHSTVVLVLIGVRWLTASDEFGVRRLDHEDDWVRVEISEALASTKPVVPILVDGAAIPPSGAFRHVKCLEHLVHRQAVEFSSKGWDESVNRICTLLERHGFQRARAQGGGRQVPNAIRSTVPPRGGAPFHGRDDLLSDIAVLLDRASPFVVLHGAPGVGKSELAREVARRNESRFPGGRFVVDMRGSGAPVDLARLGWAVLGLVYPPGMPLADQCFQTLLSLGSGSLLIYDNAQHPEQVEAWLPPEGISATVIVTTTRDDWGVRWQTVPVPPLRDDDAMRIVQDLAGSVVPAELARRLVEQAAGLPMQLVPAALSARKAAVLGRSLNAPTGRLSGDGFDHPWSIVDPDARLLLFACTFFHPERVSQGTLEAVLAETLQWRRRRTETAISIAKDQGFLEGHEPLRMHQLLSRFIRQRQDELDVTDVQAIAGQSAALLVQTATAVTNNPANAEQTLALLSFALEFHVWESALVRAADAHAVGFALSQIGRFEEALPWLRRAAEIALPQGEQSRQAGLSLHEVGFCLSRMNRHDEAQQVFEQALDALVAGGIQASDDHTYQARTMHQIGYCLSKRERYDEARGWYERSAATAQLAEPQKVDHETISASLHQVGICLIRLGRADDALGWFERAKDATLLGDEHERVDYESLGRTLAQIAYCLTLTGRYGEAIDVSKRAVEAKKRGDIHGRVDAVSVGRSLHQVGYWLTHEGRHEEALVLYERAAAITTQGDVYGRIDHESIGRSLHQVAASLVALDRQAEARGWLERALSEKRQGDTFGRVDERSLKLSSDKLASLTP